VTTDLDCPGLPWTVWDAVVEVSWGSVQVSGMWCMLDTEEVTSSILVSPTIGMEKAQVTGRFLTLEPACALSVCIGPPLAVLRRVHAFTPLRLSAE
jgi:hypothetical protein